MITAYPTDNEKIKEFLVNNKVSFTTIPVNSNEHVRTNKATVHKSGSTIFDMKEGFINKISGYEALIEQAGDELELYEIHFKKAMVTLDFMRSGEITL